MIIKYLCEVNETGKNVIVYYNIENDFWFLPVSFLLRRGLSNNHFKTIQELELELDCSLEIIHELV